MTLLHLSFSSADLAVSLIQSPIAIIDIISPPSSPSYHLPDHPIPLIPGTQPCTVLLCP